MKSFRLGILCLMAASFSCSDQGNVANYLEVLGVQPVPNSARVDKATSVVVHFNRCVDVNQGQKIRLRYLDETDPVNGYRGTGFSPPVNPSLSVGPFIWKPGKTVEVTIPKDIADPDGNRLRQSLVYHFTIAQDTVPFDLIATQPAQNDTVAPIGPHHEVVVTLTFNDYVNVGDSTLTIDPPATLRINAFLPTDTPITPSRSAVCSIFDYQPNTTYTITIPRSVADFEGQTLPRDYHLVFHTMP